MADITLLPPKEATEGSKKEDWAKSWINMDLFLRLLIKNHPIASSLVHGIYYGIVKKESTDKTPATDEKKCKLAIDSLALATPEQRSAIETTRQQIQQMASTLQTRMQSAVKNLSPAGDLITTTPKSKPMLFGSLQRQHTTPLAALVAEKPSIEPVDTEEQATRKLRSRPEFSG